MKLKYKALKFKDLHSYVTEHNGKVVKNDYCNYCRYYECDDNILVIENTIDKMVTIYFDREKVYQQEKDNLKWQNFNPLKNQQTLIFNVKNNHEIILSELFDILKMKKGSYLVNTDLDALNRAIKKYGFGNSIKNLYLNIIVFVGEYIREKRGGEWIVVEDPSFPSQVKPVFIDTENKNYDFEINILLLKNFNEKKNINVKDIIGFALSESFLNSAPEPYKY